MSYIIQPAKDGDYIVIEVQGTINRLIGAELTIESHQLGKELSIDKYFMDLTQAVNNDSTIDQFRFANTDMINNPAINRYAKCAALVAPADHSHDFIETVIRNIGINFRLFRDRQEAMAFLGIKEQTQEKRG